MMDEEFESISLSDNIPELPCVYLLMNDIELCYIGQTKNLKKRMLQENLIFNSGIYLGDKLVVPNDFDSIYYFIVEDRKERERIESQLISEFDPKWNYNGMFSTIDYRAIHPDFNPKLICNR